MKNYKLKTVLTVLCASTLYLGGCSGGDTDGGPAGDDTFEGTQFVPNGENSGSLTLDVKETDMSVSETAGFIVLVKDSNGAGVPGVQISCDSEQGVAILEPTTGAEITDEGGRISGRVGCAAPGSYQFGCRLPVGGNLRQFVTMKCAGPIPTGFNGFAGAAGGGLGTGGVDSVDDGDIRIAGVTVNDGATEGVQIDTVQDSDCDNDAATVDPESVFDGFASIKVVNNTNSTVSFTSLKVTVPSVGTSSSLALIGDTEVSADGAEVTLSSLVFSAVGPGGAIKYLPRGSVASNLPITTIGVKNVTFTLSGTTALGKSVSVKGTVAISFAGYNRCGA